MHKTSAWISASSTVALLTGALCLARGYAPETGAVSLRLVDGATGRAIPGLVRILDAKGIPLRPAELLSRGLGLDRRSKLAAPIHDWSVLARETVIHLPPGRLTIEAVAGLETELARKTLELPSGANATCELALGRFSDVGSRGWRSGNTHLHL